VLPLSCSYLVYRPDLAGAGEGRLVRQTTGEDGGPETRSPFTILTAMIGREIESALRNGANVKLFVTGVILLKP